MITVLLLSMVLLALVVSLNDASGPSRTPDPASFTGAELEALQTAVQTLATTVAATVDQVLCDNYAAAEWKVTLTKSDGTTVVFNVHAKHNGTAAADATTAGCSITRTGELATGDTFALDVDLSGAGAAQYLRLRLTVTHAAGTYQVSSWRVPQKPPQYA